MSTIKITYHGLGLPSDPNTVETNGITFKLNVPTPVDNVALARMLSHNPNFKVEGLEGVSIPSMAPASVALTTPQPTSGADPHAARTAELDKREAELDKREDELDDREGAIAEAAAKMDGMMRDIASRETAVAAREAAVADMEAALAAKVAAMNTPAKQEPTQAGGKPAATAKPGPLPGLPGAPAKK